MVAFLPNKKDLATVDLACVNDPRPPPNLFNTSRCMFS